MNLPYRLIVFDWDGTLMDSQARIVTAMQAAAQDVGVGPLTETAVKEIIGLGLQEALSALIPDGSQQVYEQLTERYRQHFLFESTVPAELFSGARETLEALSAQGYLLAVATGKARRGLDRVLADTGLEPVFHTSRCADETTSKPHPHMLEEIINELGVNSAQTLMVGDTVFDMEMAARAGAHALAVGYGVHDRQRLMTYSPGGCLEHIGEIIPWLNRPEVSKDSA